MRNDALDEIEDSVPPSFTGDPNKIYDASHTLIATINSITDTNQFCNTYNRNNNYNGIHIGQIVRINDGTYNKDWYIAGFDCEYNHIADDGSIRDNGPGIFLWSKDNIVYSQWHSSYSSTPYINSTMHTSTLPTIANNLKNILGDHLINRNVLLGSNVGTGYTGTNAYTWTTTYCTLLSGYQANLSSNSVGTRYDNGESNYVLPLFKIGNDILHDGSNTEYWLRSIMYEDSVNAGRYEAYTIYNGYDSISSLYLSEYAYARPLIYIH